MAVGKNSRGVSLRNTELETELASAHLEIAELNSLFEKERGRFALAERAARVGYWCVSLPDYRRFFSPGMLSILGTVSTKASESEDATFSWTDAEENSFFRDKITTAVQTRMGFVYRKQIQCPDGLERILDILGEPEFDINGNVIAIVGASHDVTERVGIEGERDKAQELYRIITEAASDIIMVHDAWGNTEFASAALGHTLGWTTKEVGGYDILSLMHPDDVVHILDLRRKAIPGDTITATYRLRRTDGQYIWFETTMSFVKGGDTHVLRHIVTVLRNVSERKAHELALQTAYEAAETANKAKSAFLANMSHELRTPLNAILGFAEVMSHGIFGAIDNPRYSEYVSLIHRSGKHLLDLINDVLDVSKIEAGKFKLYIEHIDLAETIAECIETMGERAASSDVELRVSVPTQGLTCSADQRALKQIILNLLSNAIKFTPPGGYVGIGATNREDRIRIEIRDDGIGIAAEDLPRLGNPFEQACNNPDLAKSGTGLGLALVRALIEQHGGHLQIESPNREGTIVTVDFPRFAEDYTPSRQMG